MSRRTFTTANFFLFLCLCIFQLLFCFFNKIYFFFRNPSRFLHSFITDSLYINKQIKQMLFYIYFSFSYSPGLTARPSFFLRIFMDSFYLLPEIVFPFLVQSFHCKANTRKFRHRIFNPNREPISLFQKTIQSFRFQCSQCSRFFSRKQRRYFY